MKKCLVALIIVFIMSFSASAEPIRLGVAEFVSRTSAADKEMLEHITEIFLKILSSSHNIEVTESKNLGNLKATNAESAAEAGKKAGCQYVLLGAVMDSTSNVDYSSPWKPVVELESVLETRVIDVATGKMILSTSGKGQVKFVYKSNIMEKEQEKSLILAASIASEKICASLAGEYPEVSSIVKSKAKRNIKKSTKNILGTLKVDRGTLSGIQEGAVYRVYFDGEEVFDSNGQSLGYDKCTVAIAEVKEVRENFCTAEITAGVPNNIRTGDKAEQITEEEARSIIDNNDFTRTRLVVSF